MFKMSKTWEDAEHKPEPWALGHCLLEHCDDKIINEISRSLIDTFEDNLSILSLLLSCEVLIPLQIYPNYKRVFVDLQKSIVKELLLKELGFQMSCI